MLQRSFKILISLGSKQQHVFLGNSAAQAKAFLNDGEH